MENTKTEDLEKEKLIAELKERLLWYQKEAKADEINPKEIEAILTLLNELEPLEKDDYFTKEASYARFEERFLPGEPGRKTGGHSGKKVWRYIGITAASIIGLFTILNIGTYATAKKGFFEFITQSATGKSFFVNGEGAEEMMGLEQVNEGEYARWEDLPPELLEKICVPTYVPEGLELEKVLCWKVNYSDMIQAVYIDNSHEDSRLEIWIEEFKDAYTWKQTINEEAVFVKEQIIDDRKCFFYQYEDKIICYYFEESNLYTILGEYSIEDIVKIVKYLQ